MPKPDPDVTSRIEELVSKKKLTPVTPGTLPKEIIALANAKSKEKHGLGMGGFTSFENATCVIEAAPEPPFRLVCGIAFPAGVAKPRPSFWLEQGGKHVDPTLTRWPWWSPDTCKYYEAAIDAPVDMPKLKAALKEWQLETE